MNADWSSSDFSATFPLPTAVVLGIIRISCERTGTSADSDDNLHATLCRLAGIEAGECLLPKRSCRPHPANLAGHVELSADMPQLSADLAIEYQELVAALGS